MEAGALRPGLVHFPACLEGENQAGTGAWNHSQLYHLWFSRRKEDARANGPSPGNLGEIGALEWGTNLLPSVPPVQPKPRAVAFFSATRNGSYGRERLGECGYAGRWQMNAGPDSTGCVTLKQAINLSEPQCLHLSQSGYTSTCPRVVLLSEESRRRNV